MLAKGSKAWIPIELLPSNICVDDECHMMSSTSTQNSRDHRETHQYYRVRITGIKSEVAECVILEPLSSEVAEALVG